MNALRLVMIAGVVVSLFACSQANAQDDGDDDAGVAVTSGLPLDNVKPGALQQRRPGIWVDQAVQRTREITQPFTPEPDLWPILRDAIITGFLTGVQDAIDTLVALLNAASLFNDLGLTDAARRTGPPEFAVASPRPSGASVPRPRTHFT